MRHTVGPRVATLIALLGCGNGTAGNDQPDGGPCQRPLLDAGWLEPFVTDVVAELAAAPRSTPAERDRARAFLMGELTAMGWAPQLHSYTGGANVYATIPATSGGDPQVVVGAHFDSAPRSGGANDNASGVAAVLAVARFLQETPCRSAPVTVVMFDQEEGGLIGSMAFAQTLAPAEVRAVHTIDQVAWDADGDRGFEIELPTGELEREWRAAAGAVGASVSVTSTSGTDHESFRARGFAAVGLTEQYVGGDTSPHIHQAADTPASIAPYHGYLVLASQLATQVILEEISPAR